MSRSAVRGVVCVTVCLFAASSAMAQQGRGFGRGGFGFGGGGNLVQMLTIETVQTELKLTADQKSKVATMQEENRGRGRGANFQDMTPEERTKFFEEAQKRTEEANKKVTELLNADQNKRVKELSLQQRIQFGGVTAALTDPELAKEFKITDSQKSSIMTIATAVGEQMRGAFQDGGLEKIAEIRKNADTEVMAILTADQKAAIEKAKGAKFDFPPPQFGRGRRGN